MVNEKYHHAASYCLLVIHIILFSSTLFQCSFVLVMYIFHSLLIISVYFFDDFLSLLQFGEILAHISSLDMYSAFFFTDLATKSKSNYNLLVELLERWSEKRIDLYIYIYMQAHQLTLLHLGNFGFGLPLQMFLHLSLRSIVVRPF